MTDTSTGGADDTAQQPHSQQHLQQPQPLHLLPELLALIKSAASDAAPTSALQQVAITANDQ
jgi:hypothetical protein